MLEYSYKVEVLRLRTTMKALEIDLEKCPQNERAKELLAIKKKELEWFESRIRDGGDPGVRIL